MNENKKMDWRNKGLEPEVRMSAESMDVGCFYGIIIVGIIILIIMIIA